MEIKEIRKGLIFFILILFIGITFVSAQGPSCSSLEKVEVNTCLGSGELFLYEDIFTEINTSFISNENQVVIFTRTELDEFTIKDDGAIINPDVIFSQNSPFKIKVYSIIVEVGSLISIESEGCKRNNKNWDSRCVQGYLVQDSEKPVYDLDSLQIILDDEAENDLFLTPGNYSYVFFDKYSLFDPSSSKDDRKLNVLVSKGSNQTILDKTYEKPSPSGTEGAVVGEFEIIESGNYTLSVDTGDSVYWPLVQCEEIKEPFCGDGNLDEGEQCDDGNNDNSDSCRNDCTMPVCGDGIKDAGEECDDGVNNGNICNPDYESICSYCSSECEIKEVEIFCGDGILQSQHEQCDDGNNKNGDGCSSECLIEEEEPFCGDGEVNQEFEECDDGNNNNFDSCRNDCSLPFCGDGIKDSGEACDDGNKVNGDGCSTTCEEEFICEHDVGIRYEYGNSFDTGIAVRQVGQDWIEDKPAELIKGENHQLRYYVDNNIFGIENNIEVIVKLNDDIISQYEKDILFFHSRSIDLDISNLACDSYHDVSIYVDKVNEIDCNLEDNFAQREIYVKCEQKPFCGDGILDLGSGEECDDGNNLDGDGCSSICKVEEICEHNISVRHSYSNSFDTGIAVREKSGNWISDMPPQLIKGNDYEVKYYVDNHESENNNATITFKLDDEILSIYNYDINNFHTNTLDLDISNLACDSYHDLSLDVLSENNGICTPDKAFDNHADREIYIGCENEPFCGDGNLDEGEQCDDGNNDNGDGCSSTCQIEIQPFCGDGKVNQGFEQCDDGNSNNFDSCRNDCTVPFCGDDIKDSGEACDDGNKVNGDGCSSICKVERPTCQGVSCGITPNITTEDFPPKIWMCEPRVVYDDATEPGRISEDGQTLVERINNYAFEGEQISWKVLVLEKNGIEKIEDVYVTVDNKIEANCQLTGILHVEEQIDETCNARILQEELTIVQHENVFAEYTCTLTVETPTSMHGESYVSVEVEDLDGKIQGIDEKEYWFFNPFVSLGISGGFDFGEVRPGTSSYSDTLLITNNAEQGSGVLMDMFISGTDFYDSASSGAKCPVSNTLELENFRYFAANGGYSTRNDVRSDSEGYVPIGYGIGFNDPNPFNNSHEIIQGPKQGPYYLGNTLSPGSDLALTLRLDLPEPCNGDFNSGSIYFWGEAI